MEHKPRRILKEAMNLNELFRVARTRPEARRLGVAALVLLLVLAIAGWWLQPAEAEAPRTSPVAGVARPTAAAPAPARVDSYADVVSQVAPAVVTIRSERRVRATSFDGDDADSFLQQFFGRSAPRIPRQPQVEGALGSGVIVGPDGYILTNNHVVAGAQQIKVEMSDHRTFTAKVVGTDAPADLAVLKIEAGNLHAITLGDSDQVRVGDVVLAIGDPLGVGETVTMGIVSAKGRATGDSAYEDFIQTDAPINQGNSGGALVNTHGELVGINSQILSPSGGSIGIGFAIPSRMAENVMQQIIRTGTVRRGMLGVTVQAVTSDMAASLGLKDVRGAIVSSVEPGGPADRAGVQQGDVITAINGKVVNGSNEVRNDIAGTAPGSRVKLSVVRDGRERQVEATLAQMPDRGRASNDNAAPRDRGRLGMSLEPLTPSLANQLGTKTKTGVVVDEVTPGGPAADAGLRSGDVIKQVNRKPVAGVEEVQQAIRESGSRPALMLVERNGNNLFIAVAPDRS
jgi:Do/DeqQ family serine protease